MGEFNRGLNKSGGGQFFKTLGDPTRVTLLSLIANNPAGEACICELTEPTGLTQPTVSHHMKKLTEVGIVTRQQRGKWAYFRVTPTAQDSLIQIIRSILPPPTPKITITE